MSVKVNKGEPMGMYPRQLGSSRHRNRMLSSVQNDPGSQSIFCRPLVCDEGMASLANTTPTHDSKTSSATKTNFLMLTICIPAEFSNQVGRKQYWNCKIRRNAGITYPIDVSIFLKTNLSKSKEKDVSSYWMKNKVIIVGRTDELYNQLMSSWVSDELPSAQIVKLFSRWRFRFEERRKTLNLAEFVRLRRTVTTRGFRF